MEHSMSMKSSVLSYHRYLAAARAKHVRTVFRARTMHVSKGGSRYQRLKVNHQQPLEAALGQSLRDESQAPLTV
jgi:hypothetical protein